MAITRNSKNWLPQVCAGGADRACYDNRPATKCRDVRFGSKADICAATSHVRFTPNSDIDCVFLWGRPRSGPSGVCSGVWNAAPFL